MGISNMETENLTVLKARLDFALEARSNLLDAGSTGQRTAAIRLFNGFYEGWPALVVDLYARTVVLYNYDHSPDERTNFLDTVQEHLLKQLDWATCVVQKVRFAPDPANRRGRVSFGGPAAKQVEEHGVYYALDLMMHQDASLYLDTRGLRQWLLERAAGWRVLNTFAYTGSLGIAALVGGARRVVQVDRNRKFLALARQSAMLNRLDLGKMKLLTADYFSQVANYKRSGETFDCVIVDPPFFSTTNKGTIDQVRESVRLINKVRPLVVDGGWLVAINNALFLSGAQYIYSLERLCEDGYLSVEALIPVPEDITGYPDTICISPPYDPAPFNHPTKIALLQVRRKE